MVTELSYTKINSIRLQLALRRLVRTADETQIQFNIDKSEYSHFHKDRDSINIGIILTFITNEDSKIVKIRL
jgi:hypothetical protein